MARPLERERTVAGGVADRVGVTDHEQLHRSPTLSDLDLRLDQLDRCVEFGAFTRHNLRLSARKNDVLMRDLDLPWEQIDGLEEALLVVPR